MKTCTKCKEAKAFELFPRNARNKDGYDSQCKICANFRNKLYRTNNYEKYKQAKRDYYHDNIDKVRSDKRKSAAKYKTEKQVYDLQYRQLNKEKILKWKKDWTKLHKDDPIFKIKTNLRRRVHHVLKGTRKCKSTFELIGCTAEEFKLHIESQFTEGMSWDNYGPKGWHIDHKIPCYKFDLSDPEQQKQCFHYSNQRPLWAKDNLSRLRD